MTSVPSILSNRHMEDGKRAKPASARKPDNQFGTILRSFVIPEDHACHAYHGYASNNLPFAWLGVISVIVIDSSSMSPVDINGRTTLHNRKHRRNPFPAVRRMLLSEARQARCRRKNERTNERTSERASQSLLQWESLSPNIPLVESCPRCFASTSHNELNLQNRAKLLKRTTDNALNTFSGSMASHAQRCRDRIVSPAGSALANATSNDATPVFLLVPRRREASP